MSHLNLDSLTFSTNFCLFKSSLSGNSVWPHASGFQKLAKMDHFLAFLMKFYPRSQYLRRHFWEDFKHSEYRTINSYWGGEGAPWRLHVSEIVEPLTTWNSPSWPSTFARGVTTWRWKTREWNPEVVEIYKREEENFDIKPLAHTIREKAHGVWKSQKKAHSI